MTVDFIAVDTNVFGHIHNKNMNTENHIYKLLKSLVDLKVLLLIDDEGVIRHEYKHHIERKIERLTIDNRIILRLWMDPQNHECVTVDESSLLWNGICAIVPEEQDKNKEEVDRIFVYVAFVKDRILISNDEKHIINNRDKLKSKAEGMDLLQADVMTSKEAHKKLEKH